MSNVDSSSQEQAQCPLCHYQLEKPLRPRVDNLSERFFPVECAVCGKYDIEGYVHHARMLPGLPSDHKPLLSAIIRRTYEFTGRPMRITRENCEQLASQAPDKNDVPSKVRYLLGYIAHKSSFPGDKVTLTSLIDYPICFAANKDEFEFYIQYAIDAGFVDKHCSGMLTQPHFCLTTKGWEETRRVPTHDSSYAFVAMSFDKDNTLLTRAFEQAIKPAIEDDAGFKEALRVDRKEFLGDIVFEIIARIKESRFIVADVTQHRNGVYFEAGYAMGMGLPVIWMCHKDDMDEAHFDTSHLNHILWDDIADLRKKLANRIIATIGKGPQS